MDLYGLRIIVNGLIWPHNYCEILLEVFSIMKSKLTLEILPKI